MLFDSVTTLHGVGAARAKQLEALGIRTLYDLIAHFPRDYEDRTQLRRISDLTPGTPSCFEAMVISQPRNSRIQKGRTVTRLSVADQSGRLNLVFFNQDYVGKMLEYGVTYFFYGRLEEDFSRMMVNPVFERQDQPGYLTRRIVPVYSLTASLSNKLLSKTIAQALDACCGQLSEILPATLRAKYELCDIGYAYETVHRPASFKELEIARRRLVFEEFFIFSAGLSLARSKRIAKPHAPYADLDMEPYYAALPFSFTAAQRRAVGDILTDFSSSKPMNRLVQGDVGSGKTLVAAACAWAAGQAGMQTAFMAPTEILAEQHLKTLTCFLSPFGMRVDKLTGSMTAKEKREVKVRLASGETALVVGTHALLTADVEFSSPALVITDEQHRFGVNQRGALSAKGKRAHTLVMSATPIPRTLALMIYGDLDVSVIDELPPGRQKVDTFTVNESYRQRLYGFMEKLVREGRQVFVVCPMVEENDETDCQLKSAEEHAKELAARFPHLRVECVHGRMKAAEKNSVMAAVVRGEVDILVSTTVIEVGVDVPNAALMVVENAERFGLSQLHQLRGRVGRGGHKSWCILVSDSRTEEARARLSAMCRTNDGFRISEEDLRLRGPGDFFGSRQHGLPEMHIAGLGGGMDVLKTAQDAAHELLKDDPELRRPENAALRERVRALFEAKSDTLN